MNFRPLLQRLCTVWLDKRCSHSSETTTSEHSLAKQLMRVDEWNLSNAIMQAATKNLELSTFRWQACNEALELGKGVSAMLSLSRGVACWKKCPRSQQCGYEGCQELYNKLLHRQRYQSEITDQRPSSYHDTELKGLRNTCYKEPYSKHPEMDTFLTTSVTYVTEGNGQRQQTSMKTTDDYRPDYIALRTIPVILRNGDRTLKASALLDNGSTKSQCRCCSWVRLARKNRKKAMVNVLNGQVETFKSKPVEFQLESMNGSVNMTVNAYTANRVTGDMRVFDWNKCKGLWPYLKNIDFPHCSKREIVDLLIGQDCAYLHSAFEEVRGKPSEHIARLTPLRWTCVGTPGQRDGSMLQTNFASTFFVRDQSSLERLNANLKKIWELEEEPLMHEPPVIRLEEKLALQTAEQSVNYENQIRPLAGYGLPPPQGEFCRPYFS